MEPVILRDILSALRAMHALAAPTLGRGQKHRTCASQSLEALHGRSHALKGARLDWHGARPLACAPRPRLSGSDVD